MEKQIDDLVYQLRELIPTLQGLGPSPATSSSGTASKAASSTDRLIVALGQLSTRLEKGKLSRDAEIKAVEDFTKSVEKNAKALDEEADAVAKREEARQKILADQEKAAKRAAMTQKERDKEDQKDRKDQKERDIEEKKAKKRAENAEASGVLSQMQANSHATKQVYSQLGYLGNTSDLLKTQFLDLTGGGLGAATTLRGIEAAAEGVIKSLATFSSAIYKGERGAAVSAKALTALSKPVLEFVSMAGTLVGLVSMFLPATRAVKLFGNVLGGFISKFGKWVGPAVAGLAGLGKAAVDYNELAAEQADRLFKSFRDLSAAGVNVAGGMDGVFDTLQSLGYSASQIEDFNRLLSASTGKLSLMAGTAGEGARRFADVAGGLSKSDLGYQLEMLGMSVEEQRESALAYMNIQARTGQLQSKNTQQLIAESAAFAKELDLSAQLMGTSRKAQQEAQEAALTETRFRAALIDAEQRGDKEKMDLLRQAQKAAAMVRATGDERGARGILQGAAGGLTTQESIAAEQTYNVQRILAQGSNLSDAEMARQLAESAKTMLGLTAGVSAFVGQIDTMQTSITGMDDFVKRIGAISEAAAKQNLSIDDFLKSEQGRRMAQGGDTKAQTEAGRTQQAAAQLQDRVVSTYNIAADINKAASEKFRDAVEAFSKVAHRVKPVPGGTAGSPAGTTSAAPEQGFWSSLWNGPSGPRRGQVKTPASGATTGEQQLLDLIGQGESRGNYNALVYGNKDTPGSADLTNMTIAQVQEYQRGMIGRGHASTAVGKYQMIEKTLAEQVKKAGLDPTTTKFDQKTQDLLARQLIQQAGYGKKDTATVMYNLAGTWASLPQDMSGRGRYDGYNRNQSVINPQDLHAALVAPASGYRTQTPTASAVISPVDQTPAQAVAADQSAQLAQRMAMLESQSNNSSNIRIAQIAEALLDRLDRLVDVASDQLGVSNKILKSRS